MHVLALHAAVPMRLTIDHCTQDVLALSPQQEQSMVAEYESMLARLKAIAALPEARLANAEVRARV